MRRQTIEPLGNRSMRSWGVMGDRVPQAPTRRSAKRASSAFPPELQSFCRSRLRRGSTILEAMIAATIVVAALAATGQLAASSARAARTAEDRLLAAEEASNILERLFVLPWDELTPDIAVEQPLSTAAQERLRDPQLEATVVDASDSPDDSEAIEIKRITVSIRWRNAAGEWVQPMRLSAWRSRARDE